jgi:hypothetical protein
MYYVVRAERLTVYAKRDCALTAMREILRNLV